MIIKNKINMKKRILVLSILLLNAIYAFAQEKEFVIDKEFNDVITQVSNFQNQFLDDFASASGDDKIFETEINIKEEQYLERTGSNYLKLKYKNKEGIAIMTSNWSIKLEKISNNKTKVLITLMASQPDNLYKKNIDIAKTVSSGKLEKDLKDYIDNNSANDNAENREEIFRDSTAFFVEEKNSDFLKNLLDKNKLIPLPTNVEYFTKKLKFEPVIADNKLCEKGHYYIWNFDSEVNLIYSRLKDKTQYYSIAYFGEEKISNLPLNLSFNSSTFDECKSKFAKYKPKWHQETESINENESTAFLVLEFKTEQYYVQLGFYNNHYLTSVQLSTSKI
jgi:hypothetical protein